MPAAGIRSNDPVRSDGILAPTCRRLTRLVEYIPRVGPERAAGCQLLDKVRIGEEQPAEGDEVESAVFDVRGGCFGLQAPLPMRTPSKCLRKQACVNKVDLLLFDGSP